jgi:2-keto-3-deoxy-L-rhamnonate aldolase RhmA
VRENPVKRALARGETVLGTLVFEFATTGIARLAAAAGAEFVILDQEHTGWGLDRVKTVLAAARAADTVPVVRVPAAEYHLVAGALDVGAMGIMVPMVESAEQARRIVSAAKYPPLGRRGVGLLYRHDWVEGDLPATLQRANAEGLLIAQIETAAGVEQVDEIAAVDGIDLLWLGHFDLSASLGVPGDFASGVYSEAVDALLAAAERHGKPVGLMAGTVEDGLAAIERGFRAIGWNGDLWLYQSALRDGLERLAAARRARGG